MLSLPAGGEIFYRGLREGLIKFAAREIELSRREEDGRSYRAILQDLLKRAKTDERRAELEEKLKGPDLPPAVQHVWNTYVRFSRRRGDSGFWGELDAFCRLTGMTLQRWEVEAIEALDDVYLASMRSPIAS